jgi:glycine/D-amino acid oxidase-like deaminating enzyme
MNILSDRSAGLIIAGGGIIGTSVAYYFIRDNPETEVPVFEKNDFCSGNTSLSAALLFRVRPFRHIIPLSHETYLVIGELVEITGDSIPVSYNGAVHVATTISEIRGLVDMALCAAARSKKMIG